MQASECVSRKPLTIWRHPAATARPFLFPSAIRLLVPKLPYSSDGMMSNAAGVNVLASNRWEVLPATRRSMKRKGVTTTSTYRASY